MTFEQYTHHDKVVWVRSDLRGTHRANCLCYSCAAFKPDEKDNCRIAQMLYKLDVAFDLVTPVYECPVFQEKKS